MFHALHTHPADKIVELMQMFKADPRSEKIDLGVGVYRNAEGITPVMRAVKAAEKQLWEQESTKAYTSLTGDPAFAEALSGLLLGEAVPAERIAAAATPGGTGAVRQGFDLAHMASPNLRVFVSDPTWPNHLSILRHLNIEIVPYRYLDSETGAVNFAGMMEDLAKAGKDDVVLLHGCCHNPSGANLTLPQWQDVANLLNTTGALPMIDIAYQGFGDGLEADAAGTRLVAASVPRCLIAASCSKNFGIYRERTGLLIAITENAEQRGLLQDNLSYLNRQNFSFPPDHGARLVTMVLNDPALRADWVAELEDVRRGMLELRSSLVRELSLRVGSDRFGFLGEHRGMFSRLGATPEQVVHLREKYGIYMVGDSRINIAGLNAQSVPILAQAVAETLR